jgi:DNA-binding response OmpR family regulator
VTSSFPYNEHLIHTPDGTTRGPRPTVLLVDAHEDSLELYGLALEVFGLTPALARSADEAWALACVTPPAVVVTEAAIPHTDGWTLIQRIRAELSATLPIIVLSTRGDDEVVRARASAAGCHAVLVKPCPPELLADTLRNAVSRPRA